MLNDDQCSHPAQARTHSAGRGTVNPRALALEPDLDPDTNRFGIGCDLNLLDPRLERALFSITKASVCVSIANGRWVAKRAPRAATVVSWQMPENLRCRTDV